ncbi:hypothetical protein HDU97_006276 [Phlyctochytrium planicorne]|nr:hypothetical protein HDU97_006276 [Phlyctochytrium planicorne]
MADHDEGNRMDASEQQGNAPLSTQDHKDVKKYHIFISYRVKTDAEFAERLSDKLRSRIVEPAKSANLKDLHFQTFLDRQSLVAGKGYKDQFLGALSSSCIVMPIISDSSIALLTELQEGAVDSVLAEWQHALELKAKGKLDIIPLLVGYSTQEGGYRRFSSFNTSSIPDVRPQELKRTARDLVAEMFAIQGIFVDPADLDDRLTTINSKFSTEVWPSYRHLWHDPESMAPESFSICVQCGKDYRESENAVGTFHRALSPDYRNSNGQDGPVVQVGVVGPNHPAHSGKLYVYMLAGAYDTIKFEMFSTSDLQVADPKATIAASSGPLRFFDDSLASASAKWVPNEDGSGIAGIESSRTFPIPIPRPSEKFEAEARNGSKLQCRVLGISNFAPRMEDRFAIEISVENLDSSAPLCITGGEVWWKMRSFLDTVATPQKDGEELVDVEKRVMEEGIEWVKVEKVQFGEVWNPSEPPRAFPCNVGVRGATKVLVTFDLPQPKSRTGCGFFRSILGPLLFDVELTIVGGGSTSFIAEHSFNTPTLHQLHWDQPKAPQGSHCVSYCSRSRRDLAFLCYWTTADTDMEGDSEQVNAKSVVGLAYNGGKRFISVAMLRTAVIAAEKGAEGFKGDSKVQELVVLRTRNDFSMTVYGLVDLGCRRVYSLMVVVDPSPIKTDTGFKFKKEVQIKDEQEEWITFIPVPEYGDSIYRPFTAEDFQKGFVPPQELKIPGQVQEVASIQSLIKDFTVLEEPENVVQPKDAFERRRPIAPPPSMAAVSQQLASPGFETVDISAVTISDQSPLVKAITESLKKEMEERFASMLEKVTASLSSRSLPVAQPLPIVANSADPSVPLRGPIDLSSMQSLADSSLVLSKITAIESGLVEMGIAPLAPEDSETPVVPVQEEDSARARLDKLQATLDAIAAKLGASRDFPSQTVVAPATVPQTFASNVDPLLQTISQKLDRLSSSPPTPQNDNTAAFVQVLTKLEETSRKDSEAIRLLYSKVTEPKSSQVNCTDSDSGVQNALNSITSKLEKLAAQPQVPGSVVENATTNTELQLILEKLEKLEGNAVQSQARSLPSVGVDAGVTESILKRLDAIESSHSSALAKLEQTLSSIQTMVSQPIVATSQQATPISTSPSLPPLLQDLVDKVEKVERLTRQISDDSLPVASTESGPALEQIRKHLAAIEEKLSGGTDKLMDELVEKVEKVEKLSKQISEEDVFAGPAVAKTLDNSVVETLMKKVEERLDRMEKFVVEKSKAAPSTDQDWDHMEDASPTSKPKIPPRKRLSSLLTSAPPNLARIPEPTSATTPNPTDQPQDALTLVNRLDSLETRLDALPGLFKASLHSALDSHADLLSSLVSMAVESRLSAFESDTPMSPATPGGLRKQASRGSSGYGARWASMPQQQQQPPRPPSSASSESGAGSWFMSGVNGVFAAISTGASGAGGGGERSGRDRSSSSSSSTSVVQQP